MTTPPPVPGPAPLPPARVTTPPEGDRRSVARTRRRRVLAAALALLLVAGLGWAALQSGSRGPAGANRYTTVAAERGSITQTVTTSGTVAQVNEMSVRFPASATVLEVRAAVGDTVAPGDVLAVIDDTALRTQVLTAQAAVDAAALSVQQMRQADAPASGPVVPSTPRRPVVDAGGGMPAPPPLALPEAPDPYVDLTPLEAARAEAEAAAAVVAERTALAGKAVAAMQDACRPVAPTPSATPSATPSPSATPDPTPDPSATPLASPQPSPDPSASPGPSVTPDPSATPGPPASPTPEPPASPSPEPTVDSEACLAAVEQVTAAQAAVTEAQAAATLANARGPEAVGGVGGALAAAVEQVRGWIDAVNRALGGWQQQVARAQSAPPMGSTDGGFPDLSDLQSAGGGGAPDANRSAIVSAEVALAKARRELASAQEHLEAATLRAPMGGTLSALPWTVGSTATASERAVVTAPGAVTVSVTVPASQFLALRQGQQATVRAAGGVEAVATVASKALVPNAMGAFPVTILTTGENAQGLPGGSSATVEIGVGSATDVVVVPLSAVTRTDTEGTVRLLRGDEVVEVPARFGSVGDTHVEVLEGVAVGDLLVVADAARPLPGLDFGGPG